MPVFAAASKSKVGRGQRVVAAPAPEETLTSDDEVFDEEEEDFEDDEDSSDEELSDDGEGEEEEGEEGDEEEEEEEEDEAQEENDGEDDGPREVDVEFSEPAAWVERMTLSATKPLPKELNPNDDPKREEVFMQHALLSAQRGISLLERAQVPWERPTDFYAEMYKSDVHMNKIRQSLEKSKSAVQERAQRRAMRDQKKFGKEVQAEVERQRAKSKRDNINRVSEWRKKRGRTSESLEEALQDTDAPENAKKRTRFEGGKGGRGRAQGASKSLRPGGKRPGKSHRR